MTDSPEAKIDAYYRCVRGCSRVLTLTVNHLLELDEPRQKVTLDLLDDESDRAVRLSFEGVQSLRIGNIHQGITCYLSIRSIAEDQLEGLKYEVHNGEQDFTLSFVCTSFDLMELGRNER